MTHAMKSGLFFSLWATASVVLGSVLTSYHQPFVLPKNDVLSLAGPGDSKHWRAVHLLSGSCGCSQLVMKHLLKRGLLSGVVEQVIVIDGPEKSLPGSLLLLESLSEVGFRVSHINIRDIPAATALHGVPLLVYANQDDRTLYAGGYGRAQDGDQDVYRELRAGGKAKPLPVLGCAIGISLRRSADPFGLKY